MTVTTRNGRQLDYRITDLAVVHKDEVSIELITPRRRMTLVTCYPFDAIAPGSPYRYIVTAVLTAELTGDTRERFVQRTSGQPFGGTQEPEPYGSQAGAFASAGANADPLDMGKLMGGLPGPPVPPRWQDRLGSVEALSIPRERVRLAGGRLVSQLGR